MMGERFSGGDESWVESFGGGGDEELLIRVLVGFCGEWMCLVKCPDLHVL